MKQSKNLFITAGHRGGSTGANANGYSEAELAIQLRNDLTKKLHEQGVVVVNDADTDSLTSVVNNINKNCTNRDLCLDLHFNSFSNASANGTEVLIQNAPTNSEIEFAEDVLNAVCSTLGTKNRGVKKEGKSQYKRLAMLSGVKCNSVLVEVCFISSQSDMVRYNSKYNELVEKMVEIIIKHVTQ